MSRNVIKRRVGQRVIVIRPQVKHVVKNAERPENQKDTIWILRKRVIWLVFALGLALGWIARDSFIQHKNSITSGKIEWGRSIVDALVIGREVIKRLGLLR